MSLLTREVCNMQYRHEMKYICSEAQLSIFQSRISCIMDIDSHTSESNMYNIRSLYFDDYYNNAFYENQAGVDIREKFRIRIYDHNPNRITLELKKKVHDKIQKIQCQLSIEQCKTLMEGQPLKNSHNYPPVLLKLCTLMKTRLMRPVVIVEYDRTPYVYNNGNVRITFDRNIASSSELDRFLSKTLNKRFVMPSDTHILEIKWDEYLPDFIYKLQIDNMQRTSFSKFYLCRKLSLNGGILL